MSDPQAFTLTVSLGNAALRTPEDVAELLGRVARRVEAGDPATLGYFQTIHDANGNDVGRWKFGYVDRPGYALEEVGEDD